MIDHAMLVLIYLLAGHALADYPLQGDFLARQKNHKLGRCSCGKDIVHVIDQHWRLSTSGEVCTYDGHWHKPVNSFGWKKSLLAHCLIHAGMVALVTQNWILGVLEFCVHWPTDYSKCDGKITANQDQAIHYGCKLLWWAIWLFLEMHK